MNPAFSILFILLITISTVYSRQIEMPVIRQNENRDIKINHMEIINEPNFEFSSVYERRVYEVKNNSLGNFKPCQQNKPQVQFTITDEIVFKGRPERPAVSYKFDDIKYSQFLLDTYYENNTVYMIFGDAMAAVVDLGANKNIKSSQVFKINGLEPNTKLQVGYFCKLKDSLVFINNAYAISMNKTQAHKLEGYQGGNSFQSAISIEGSFIAVAFEQIGVFLYKVLEGRLEMAKTINPLQISMKPSIQLADLAYFEEHKTLLILDEDSGVISFQIDLTPSGDINANKGSVFIRKQLCELIHIYKDEMYLVCHQIYRISLDQWPRIQQQTIPHPNIKVREIYADGTLVAFVGRNVFRLIYLNRLANYYQDTSMDKLIFDKDLFISANEVGLFFGKFDIVKPYITCQTFDSDIIGDHLLVFKTVAECNETYFKQIGFTPSSLGKVSSSDTCVYTVYRNVYFWKTGKIMMMPILITFIVLLVIAITVFLIWLLKRISLRRMEQQLAEYTALGAATDMKNQKHRELVEEKSNNTEPNENQDEKKPSQFELKNQMHDIQ